MTRTTRRSPRQVVRDTCALAETLAEHGLRTVGGRSESGRTESHGMLVDSRPRRITGRSAEVGERAVRPTRAFPACP